ncbi:MAG: aspartyl/glutamyl-tRNA amidotransferase subunit A [Deltaproteobacteria bacterium]|nr:aspartyl/glutamyl-tRNA amidotransferase subunit A [Deltaproteobacteria bacterium]
MKALDLEELTIADIAPRIRRKEISPVELTKRYLDRTKRLNPALNAYLTVTEERALADAKRAEGEIRKGKYRGVLHGIPFSIKDNIATKGVRTTAGSKILSEWVPDFDATVVERLREGGAIILGKTNMHEWAKGSNSINPFYGTSYNPWDTSRIPGGSSGGSAVAVAASLCMASLGTDSAGSVRNPASLCGTVGLKPTYGRVSCFGGVPGTGGYTVNHFGILTKTVKDCALVLRLIAGCDPKDPLSSEEPVPDYSKKIGIPVKGIKVGVIKGYFDELVVGEVRSAFEGALKTLETLGMKTEEIAIPHIDLMPALHTATTRPEGNSDHDPYLRTRPRDYSPGLLYTLIAGLLIPASVYVTAQRVRRLVCEEFDAALGRVQVIVAPTVSIPAPTIEECNRGYVEWDGKRIDLQDRCGNLLTRYTIPFNVTGLPAASICCGFSSLGLPIGMQMATRPFQEGVLFQVAHAYEKAAEWYRRKPQL